MSLKTANFIALVTIAFFPISVLAATTNFCPSISRSLYRGLTDAITGGEVSELQKFLKSDPTIYPEGLVTGYFGPLTERAVQRFQAANGIIAYGTPATTGYGVVGPKTRAVLSFSCAAASSSAADGQNSIKVLSPNGNEVLPIGAAQTIKWQASGAMPLVNITLKEWFSPCVGDVLCGAVNALAKVYTVHSNAANSGEFSWTVGKAVNNIDIPGGRYALTVSNPEKTVFDSSDSFFAIAPSGEAPVISLFYPTSTAGNVAVTRGTISGMMWFAPVSVLHVNIFLEQGSAKYQIAKNAANENWFVWNVGQDVGGAAIPAGNYVINIEDASSSLSGKSAFAITLN